MATKRAQKNPAIFHDGIFTHFLTILIFITPPDGLSQGSDLYYPQKFIFFNLLAVNKQINFNIFM